MRCQGEPNELGWRDDMALISVIGRLCYYTSLILAGLRNRQRKRAAVVYFT